MADQEELPGEGRKGFVIKEHGPECPIFGEEVSFQEEFASVLRAVLRGKPFA